MSAVTFFQSTGAVDFLQPDSHDRRFWPVFSDDPFRACTLCDHHRTAPGGTRLCGHPDLQVPGRVLPLETARRPDGPCGPDAYRAAARWNCR